MITYAGNKATIVAATVKDNVTWLFQMDKNGSGAIDYYWSHKDFTYSAQAHTGVVLEFDGITMNRAQSESGIQAPSEFTFTISNKDNTLTTGDFSDARLTLRLIVKAGALEEEMRTWVFRVTEVSPAYQTLTFHCVDWLQAYLEGDYPNTPRIHNLFPRANLVGDNSCVPLIIGKPCIPNEPIPVQHITNGDMEIDGNWANYGAPTTNERSNTQAHSGTYSRKIVHSAGGAREGIRGDTFATVTGKCYTASFWVRGSHVYIKAQRGDTGGFNTTWVWPHSGLDHRLWGGLSDSTWTKLTATWKEAGGGAGAYICLLYTSPSPRDRTRSRMPSSA